MAGPAVGVSDLVVPNLRRTAPRAHGIEREDESMNNPNEDKIDGSEMTRNEFYDWCHDENGVALRIRAPNWCLDDEYVIFESWYTNGDMFCHLEEDGDGGILSYEQPWSLYRDEPKQSEPNHCGADQYSPWSTEPIGQTLTGAAEVEQPCPKCDKVLYNNEFCSIKYDGKHCMNCGYKSNEPTQSEPERGDVDTSTPEGWEAVVVAYRNDIDLEWYDKQTGDWCESGLHPSKWHDDLVRIKPTEPAEPVKVLLPKQAMYNVALVDHGTILTSNSNDSANWFTCKIALPEGRWCIVAEDHIEGTIDLSLLTGGGE